MAEEEKKIALGEHGLALYDKLIRTYVLDRIQHYGKKKQDKLVVNPTNPSDLLTGLTIDDKDYKFLPDNIVAVSGNDATTATEDLTSITIGENKYKIPGCGNINPIPDSFIKNLFDTSYEGSAVITITTDETTGASKASIMGNYTIDDYATGSTLTVSEV